MGNCKDCKHWAAPDLGERGLCRAIGDWADSDRDRFDPAVMQCEGFDRKPAELWTKPDFGCVLFEQRVVDPYSEMDKRDMEALYRQTRRENLRVRASMGYRDAIETLASEFGERVDEA